DVEDVGDVDFAVADSAGSGAAHYRLHHGIGLLVADNHLELYFGLEVDDVFRAAVKFGASLLPSEAFDFVGGQSADTDAFELRTDRIEGKRLDDGFDLLHASRRVAK